MPTILPLILIALGGAAMVALSGWRALLGGLALQWLGLALVVGELFGELNAPMLAEAVAGLACVAVMGLTLRSLERVKPHELPGLDDEQRAVLSRQSFAGSGPVVSRQSSVGRLVPTADYLWLLAIVFMGGVAGFGLARVIPLGLSELYLLAFYWTLITGVLVLVMHVHDPARLAVGLLAFFNGMALAVYLLGVEAPGAALLGIMALVRVGVAVALAYGWVTLKTSFLDLDLGILFDAPTRRPITETAIVVWDQGSGIGDQGSRVGDQEVEGDGAVEGEVEFESEAEQQATGEERA